MKPNPRSRIGGTASTPTPPASSSTGERGATTGSLQQQRAAAIAAAAAAANASIHTTTIPNVASTSGIHSTEMPVSERAAAASESHITAMRRKLSPGEFNMAMVHFYRGEVQRANTWRNRLDTTTNWAVLTAGATLSFAFSSPTNPHFVILINSVLVAFFLFMEARRYRYYEIWSSRVRVLETGYFAQMLTDGTANVAWAEHLANDLLTPHFTISEWEAVGRRLRRNYLWIFALLAASWNLKVYLHPLPAYDFNAFLDRASVGVINGRVVFITGIVFNVVVFMFAVFTVRLREATGEVLPRHEFSFRTIQQRMTNWTRAATTLPTSRRATVRRAEKARKRSRTRSSTGTTGGGVTGELKRTEEVTSDR